MLWDGFLGKQALRGRQQEGFLWGEALWINSCGIIRREAGQGSGKKMECNAVSVMQIPIPWDAQKPAWPCTLNWGKDLSLWSLTLTCLWRWAISGQRKGSFIIFVLATGGLRSSLLKRIKAAHQSNHCLSLTGFPWVKIFDFRGG